MAMYELAGAVRAALGQSVLAVSHTDDYMNLRWDNGEVSLLITDLTRHDYNEDATPSRYVVMYRPRDNFGVTGGPRTSYRLPVDTTSAEVVACIIHEVRLRRYGIPTPSPYRWGVARSSEMIELCDALADVGLTADWVSNAYATVPNNSGGRGLVVAGRGESTAGHLTVWIGPVDPEEGLDFESALEWAFARGTPPAIVAATARYWAHDGASADPGIPGPDQPFPLPRVGLTSEMDPGLGPLIQQLHAQGLEVLRLDFAFNRKADELVLQGQDVITFRDSNRRLFTLSRHPRNVDQWSLHAAACGTDLSIPLIQIPTGTHEGAHVDWARRVRAAISNVPLPSADDDFFDVARPFPIGPVDVIAPAYLDDVFAELRHILERVAAGVSQPAPTLIRNPHDAEQTAAEWMRWMGYVDATATPIGADEGIDVLSAKAVAQVKTETVPVGRPALQRLFGVAHAEGKEALFFSLSGYTLQATDWANRVELPLFTFDYQGAVIPVNESASALFDTAST